MLECTNDAMVSAKFENSLLRLLTMLLKKNRIHLSNIRNPEQYICDMFQQNLIKNKKQIELLTNKN